MANVLEIGPHDKMSVKDALNLCARTHEDFEDVMVIGFSSKDRGDLIIRSSNMTRAQALWLLENAKLHSLGMLDD